MTSFNEASFFLLVLISFLFLLGVVCFIYVLRLLARLCLGPFRRRYRLHQARKYPWWR